jgi:cytochrome c556
MHAKLFLTAAAIALAGAALAQTAHDGRKAAMKTFGGQSKIIGDMLSGNTAFDAAAANAAMVAMQAAAAPLPELFATPETSPDTRALPAIWENKADFDARLAKFTGDINAGVAASPQDQAAVQAAFGTIAGNCSSCHEVYRKQQ